MLISMLVYIYLTNIFVVIRKYLFLLQELKKRSNIFDLLNNPLVLQTIINKKLVIPDCLKEKMNMEIEKEEKSVEVKEIVTMNNEEKKTIEKQIEKLKNEIKKKDEEIKRIEKEKEEIEENKIERFIFTHRYT
jgi:septal ring factor EnvC (AmiA/AmiB activator)